MHFDMGSIARLKRQAVQWLLQEEDFFLVVVNPGAEGVELPAALIEAGQPVGLNIGLRMAVPIPDLIVDEQGISATLSFDRTPHHCTLPWPAVLQLSAGLEHLVWVEPEPEEEPPAPGPQRGGRPRLKLV